MLGFKLPGRSFFLFIHFAMILFEDPRVQFFFMYCRGKSENGVDLSIRSLFLNRRIIHGREENRFRRCFCIFPPLMKFRLAIPSLNRVVLWPVQMFLFLANFCLIPHKIHMKFAASSNSYPCHGFSEEYATKMGKLSPQIHPYSFWVHRKNALKPSKMLQ